MCREKGTGGGGCVNLGARGRSDLFRRIQPHREFFSSSFSAHLYTSSSSPSVPHFSFLVFFFFWPTFSHLFTIDHTNSQLARSLSTAHRRLNHWQIINISNLDCRPFGTLFFLTKYFDSTKCSIKAAALTLLNYWINKQRENLPAGKSSVSRGITACLRGWHTPTQSAVTHCDELDELEGCPLLWNSPKESIFVVVDRLILSFYFVIFIAGQLCCRGVG